MFQIRKCEPVPFCRQGTTDLSYWLTVKSGVFLEKIKQLKNKTLEATQKSKINKGLVKEFIAHIETDIPCSSILSKKGGNVRKKLLNYPFRYIK